MHGAPVVISIIFPYQSFFSADFERAILTQAAGQAIASGTTRIENIAGFGVGLDPMSETPVVIEFGKTGDRNGSQAIILKPGQTFFPFGREEEDFFTTFRWGLPYGWLGGGLARLIVFRSPRAEVDWNGRPEIIIHRQRMSILAAGSDLDTYNTAANVPPNWPSVFPPMALRRQGVQVLNQAGYPALAVEPTQVIIRLNTGVAPLGQASTVRFLMYGTKGLDTDQAGALETSFMAYQDITFPILSIMGVNATPLQSSVITVVNGPLVRLGCDLAAGGGVVAIDCGDGDILTGLTMDIIRYAKL